MAFLGIRIGNDEVPLRDAAIRDPHLAAAQDVVVAVAFRLRLDPLDVTPRVRLGHAIGREQELFRQRREPFLFFARRFPPR